MADIIELTESGAGGVTQSAAPGEGKKRGPGRPSNAERAARGENVEKPRSRKAASESAPVEPMTADAKAAMAKQIQGTHAMLALMTGLPELAIGEAEAAILADAVGDVAAQYGTVIDPKTAAIIKLIGAAGIVYAPRLMQAANRIKTTKAKKNLSAGPRVVNLRNPGEPVVTEPDLSPGPAAGPHIPAS